MDRKRMSAVGILAAIVLAPSVAQGAEEPLKGSRFIEVMQDNTMSGFCDPRSARPPAA